jgi:hypothetical protein
LLFDFNTFHAFAKLRLHTEDTLSFLDRFVTLFGNSLNSFLDATENVETEELPRERVAREQREAAKAIAEGRSAPPSKKKSKTFPREAYKLHPGGDFTWFIRWLSTADQWSTRLVSLMIAYSLAFRYDNTHAIQGEMVHRTVKAHYRGTSKVKFVKQIAKGVERERIALRAPLPVPRPAPRKPKARKFLQHRVRGTAEKLPKGDPTLPYQMSDRVDDPVNIQAWIRENPGDPALRVSDRMLSS